MQIVVVGMGYVGLVSATCLAEVGHQVACYDIDAGKIRKLQQGVVPFYEPSLQEMVVQNQKAGRLLFVTDLVAATAGALAAFVAAGTPAMQATGQADTSQVIACCQTLAAAWAPSAQRRLIIIKSTVPVGTCAGIAAELAAAGAPPQASSLGVAINPEFLKEGMAVEDFMRPDRIVVGTDDSNDLPILRQIYAPFIRNGRPFLEMSSRSAEMTKYAANALLAARISLINEVANLCAPLGADIGEVHRGVGSDKRLGTDFLDAGIGYGGSCFPKDVQALAHMGEDVGCPTPILRAVHAVNQNQRERLVAMLRTQVPNLAGQTVALWGLSFKPRTDDIREAPAMVVLSQLLAAGAYVQAFDPEAMPNAQKAHPASARLTYVSAPLEACENACALLICTEWGIFRNPNFVEVRARLSRPLIVDGRNLFKPSVVTAAGLTYLSMGRAPRTPGPQ